MKATLACTMNLLWRKSRLCKENDNYQRIQKPENLFDISQNHDRKW